MGLRPCIVPEGLHARGFNRGLVSYIEVYNTQRPQRTLKNRTPCQAEDEGFPLERSEEGLCHSAVMRTARVKKG